MLPYPPGRTVQNLLESKEMVHFFESYELVTGNKLLVYLLLVGGVSAMKSPVVQEFSSLGTHDEQVEDFKSVSSKPSKVCFKPKSCPNS